MIRRAEAADWAAIETIKSGAAQWAEYGAWVIERDARVAGFLVAREVAAGELEILEIAVADGFRRRGLATALFQHASREWPGAYFLEVRESNAAARALYGRLGFEQAGVRPRYYSNPEEAAVVMRIRS